MSAQSRYSAKKIATAGGPSSASSAAYGGTGGVARVKMGAQSATSRTGKCEAMKTDVLDYGEPGHTELYRRSREALLDYVRVEYAEGDAVAESILAGAAEYPPQPTDPPAGASRTEEEIWKRKVAPYVNAQADIDNGLKQAYTLMWGQCSQRLRDKLETSSRFAIVSAVKDIFALDGMIRVQAHETMDTRRQKAWTALESKISVLTFHQEQSKLSDVEFSREFAGRVQGLKTAGVTIGKDDCVAEAILAGQGSNLGSATQAAKDAAFATAENQAIVMLYLRNINQTWHGTMVRYLEDAYATGNDIYPTSLPDAYRFLDDWKTRQRVRGVFAGRSEGVTLTTTGGETQSGKRDERYVIPGKERILCWDCGYYGHGRGNKLCPNYDPAKAGNNKKENEQVNTTAAASVGGTPAGTSVAASSVSQVSSQSAGTGGLPLLRRRPRVRQCFVMSGCRSVIHTFPFFTVMDLQTRGGIISYWITNPLVMSSRTSLC